MKKNFTSSIGLQGGSSLMVIFGVLCLVVFCMLALASSLAGSRLEKSSVEATTAYYAADSIAEEKLSELRQQHIDGTYTYTVDVTERQQLEVCVEIDGDSYNIKKWQTKYIAPWQSDDSLSVWTGNN